jgi:heat shock protein HtpX
VTAQRRVDLVGEWQSDRKAGGAPGFDAAGETILLYSDGLIERRASSLDEGLERLARVASVIAYLDGFSANDFANAATAVVHHRLTRSLRRQAVHERQVELGVGRAVLVDDVAACIDEIQLVVDPSDRHRLALADEDLEKLDREELQGVIAHEMSHVRNLDIRFSLIVGVMVGVIAILADFFLRFTFWGGGRRSNRDSGGNGIQAVILVVAIVLAILAPIISRFIQLAVSRQREYLADASSVELTRNPYGLERALAKIGGDQEVLEVANRGTQHMYFTNPIKKFEARSSGLMDTHPPILDRINRLRQLTGEAPLDAAEAAPLADLD